jgi:hypothetical protein
MACLSHILFRMYFNGADRLIQQQGSFEQTAPGDS